jgi:trans-2,3-dihydro-3-hydroxyanthranilate isomerase
MREYRYRLLNVFAIEGDRFSGNPLCVFEDARGLSDAQMQSLALQFNLSETTFIFPSERATARVRIFTPTFEMPFAGHPTLGTAQVVRSLSASGDALTLEMKAGVIPVTASSQQWTLRSNEPQSRPVAANREQLAQMLGLNVNDVGDEPLWINTGSEQLVIPLNSVAAVERAAPVLELLEQHAFISATRQMAYIWAAQDVETIQARFFFRKDTSVIEDPATGSACANLGGWFVTQRAPLPIRRTVWQGSRVGRASKLLLQVDAEMRIFVAGEVVEVGAGIFTV